MKDFDETFWFYLRDAIFSSKSYLGDSLWSISKLRPNFLSPNQDIYQLHSKAANTSIFF